jgi:ATP-dependent Clp protease ATP-binding subunit ClpA
VILMMTSNAGSREMSAASIGFGQTHKDAQSKGKKAIEKLFSPEFRNRLDETITFNALNLEIMEMIVDKFIAELNQQLAIKKVALTISPAVRTWLAEKGHDPTYGARPLSRVVQTEIKDKLSDAILFGKLQNGGLISLDISDNQLTFNYS